MNDTSIRIIECAFRLFLARGYDGTSMADLVKETGLSKGAVYHHFEDKEAIYDATIEYFFKRFFKEGDRPPEERDASVERILTELGEGLIRLLTGISAVTPDIAAYYRFVLAILPKVRPMIAEQFEQARARLEEALRREQHDSRIGQNLACDAMALHCLSSLEGAAFLCVVRGEGDFAGHLRATVRDLLKLLRQGSAAPG